MLAAKRLSTCASSVDGAALHRSVVTQELWAMRCDSAAPPPPRPDGTRHPEDAKVSIRYNLTSDELLRQRYESAFGTMRMGVLFEDMDAIAGSVAWRHVDDADPATDPPILVTASVEQIRLREPLSLDSDYSLVGSVVWTGSSSLEILVELLREDNKPALSGVFTYVARKRDGSGAEKVFRVVPQTEDEKKRHLASAEKQAALKAKRKQAKEARVAVDALTEEEKQEVENLIKNFRSVRDFPGQADDGAVLMHETALRNANMCHPQERNTAGRVFGGVLMRRALELAYATAYAFGGTEPLLKELERVEFIRPVDVGSLLALTSVVSLTQENIVHVNVNASTWQPRIRESTLANTFTFVFSLQDAPRKLKTVIPTNRVEAELQVRAMSRARLLST